MKREQVVQRRRERITGEMPAREQTLLDEIGHVLESRGYAHMTNADGVAWILDRLEEAAQALDTIRETIAALAPAAPSETVYVKADQKMYGAGYMAKVDPHGDSRIPALCDGPNPNLEEMKEWLPEPHQATNPCFIWELKGDGPNIPIFRWHKGKQIWRPIP